MESLFQGTSLCKFFARGSCHKGSACKFAHGAAALRAKPDPEQLWGNNCQPICSLGGPTMMASGQDLNKTKMCMDFKKTGACKRGLECSYAHDREEIRRGQKKKLSQAAGSQEQRLALPVPQLRSESMDSTVTSSTPRELILSEEEEEEEHFTTQSYAMETNFNGSPVEAEHEVSDDEVEEKEDDGKLSISVKNTFLHFESYGRSLFRSSSCPTLCCAA
eukprot:Skav218199  [mRNA]  locus=scaffold2232:40580:54271:- [translate_table: standard]